MNKRAFGIVAASAVAIAALAAPVAAAAPKATGDVWSDNTANGGGLSHMVFNAQATNPAKGTFTYSDPAGAYTVDVQAVRVTGDEAWFAGPVVDNSHPGVQRPYAVVAVLDGGESAVGVDAIAAEFYGSLQDAKDQFGTLQPEKYGLFASAGNIQVH